MLLYYKWFVKDSFLFCVKNSLWGGDMGEGGEVNIEGRRGVRGRYGELSRRINRINENYFVFFFIECLV